MSSKSIGIEEARKTLGDLVTAAQQGTDIILTRNRRPVARIIRGDAVKTIARPTPYQLADAITDMAQRYGQAERRRAYEVGRRGTGLRVDEAEIALQERACRRRFAALQRLTEALRKQADA